MNYVLSEKSAQWLRRQMAKSQGYKPAAAAPSRLVRRDGAASVSAKPLYPLTVRFVPSDEPGAGVGDGDYIIYVPAGSVVVNGAALQAEDVPLAPYVSGGYADKPDWYALPQMADGDSVVLGITYNPEDRESPLLIDIYTGEPVEEDPEDGTAEREFIVANVSVTQPGDGAAGGVRVFQVLEGPLVLEIGVETLNGAMGRLDVVGGKDGVTVVGNKEYWIKVERADGSKDIVVSLSDVPPDDDGGDEDGSYCNNISDEYVGENEISRDFAGGGGDGGGSPENQISYWPCKSEEGE